MKYIAPIAVAAILLLQASGAVPDSSVGGPMTLALAFFAAALAVGIHEAWVNKRGVLGWILNVVVSLAGAFLAAEVGNLIFESLLIFVAKVTPGLLQGPLATAQPLLFYVALAAMMLLILLGAWSALKFVSRWR